MVKSLNRIFILFLVLLCISVALLNKNNSMPEKFSTTDEDEDKNKCNITFVKSTDENDDKKIMEKCKRLNLDSPYYQTCDKKKGENNRDYHSIYCSDWDKEFGNSKTGQGNCADNGVEVLEWRNKCNEMQCRAVKHCRDEIAKKNAADDATAVAAKKKHTDMMEQHGTDDSGTRSPPPGT